MADLRHLYQDTLLEHYRAPRHAEPLASPDASATRQNPRCGDACDASLTVEAGRIREISVVSRGCTVAVASGSIRAELCAGSTLEDARSLLERAASIISGMTPVLAPDEPGLAPLAALRDYPTRHQCALLARDAIATALDQVEES